MHKVLLLKTRNFAMKAFSKYIFIGLLFIQNAVWACDDALKTFPRDCHIQDRYHNLKNQFALQNVNIEDVVEYRVVRFVDRYNWERAKLATIKPHDIYKPAPDTWIVWDAGIRDVMNKYGKKNSLFFENEIDYMALSYINKVLLTNDFLNLNVKDHITDQKLNAGEYRKDGNSAVGFNSPNVDYTMMIQSSEVALEAFQFSFETKAGASFSTILKERGVLNADHAHFRSEMKMDTSKNFVYYTPSNVSYQRVEWVLQFLKYNLEKYKQGTPLMTPYELAAFVQKWFVSIHPFADGNGRTSRALQDLILAHFDLPFVPAGDLQNDATEVLNTYIDRTYLKVEESLSRLELCFNQNIKYKHCLTVDAYNQFSDQTPKLVPFKKVERRKD